MEYCRVLVVITTQNEEKNIANCLNAVNAQDYPRQHIEVIVVDNDSSDHTPDIARRYTDKVFNCGPERSAQRNFGIRQAAGKYALFLDADMALSEGVVSECVGECEAKGVIALYIPEEIVGRGFWIRARNFERSFYNATAIDCARFIRMDKFFEIGGFDEMLTGPEDWDFDRRIRALGAAGIIKSPIYHNEGEFNLVRYLRKKAYYSRSFARYIQKWGREDSLIKKQLGFLYRFIIVFAENGKWVKLLRHPVLAAGMYYLRLLVGVFSVRYLFTKNMDNVQGRETK